MIGRKKEIDELNRLYNSNKAELVAVFGRRRVGKTYLINHFFKNDFVFKHTGLSPEDDTENLQLNRQLMQFYTSLLFYGLNDEKKPQNWYEAFFLLQKLILQHDNEKRMVVFIDELPWLDTKKSEFIKAFEGFWNNFGCAKDNLMLIICGSATSWFQNNLINNHGGLYGRVTYEIKLAPFTLHECEEFLCSNNVKFSRYDIIQCYMIFGGIPYYLNYINPSYSLAQNIDELFFKKNALFSLEFDRLFASVFTSPDKIKDIVKLLYKNSIGFTKNEILEKLKMKDGGTFSKYLNSLIVSDFVIEYIPFGFKKTEKHYKLVDPFCLFYLTFLNDRTKLNEKYWSQNVTSQSLSSWRGYAFENVCFNHIEQIKFALGISSVITQSSAFYNKDDGYQIDLIISRNDNVINMCELKFYSTKYKVNKDYYLKIMERTNLLIEKISKKKVVQNTLITTYGLDSNEYSNVFNNVITADELFKF